MRVASIEPKRGTLH